MYINENTINKRNVLLDVLKGLAIIAMIVGHTLVNSDLMNPVANAIYAFHMPLFFIISGYLFFYTVRGNRYLWLGKRAWSLLIPYSVFNVLYFFTQSAYSFGTWIEIGFLYNQIVWFLGTLFECSVLILFIDWLYRRFDHNLALFWSLGFIVLILIFDFLHFVDNNNYLGKNILGWFFSFFFMGYMIARYKNFFEIIGERTICVLGIIGFPIIMQLTDWKGGWLHNDFFPTSYYIYGDWTILMGRYLQALFGFCFVYFIAKMVELIPKLSKNIAWLGTMTLGIYLFDGLVLSVLLLMMKELGAMMIMILGGLITVFIVWLVKRWNVTDAVLLGNWTSLKKILGQF